MSTLGHSYGRAVRPIRVHDDTGAYLYPGYVMTVEVASSIPLLDILYLQQGYRNEHGGIPH